MRTYWMPMNLQKGTRDNGVRTVHRMQGKLSRLAADAQIWVMSTYWVPLIQQRGRGDRRKGCVL